MSDKIRELTKENFLEGISQGQVLVDFWAPWCGPCKMQGPILETVVDDVPGKICKVNVDDNMELAVKYGVVSIPMLILFKDGELMRQVVGLQQADAVKEMFE